MTIFDEKCLTDPRTKELHAFLLAQKTALNQMWQTESAFQGSTRAKQLGRILQAIELCNLYAISPADYVLIASLSDMVDT